MSGVVTNRIREDRVSFLSSKESWGYSDRAKVGKSEVGVILWLGEKGGETPVTMVIDSGAFNLHQTLTAKQARMIANALLAAAEEAEAVTA